MTHKNEYLIHVYMNILIILLWNVNRNQDSIEGREEPGMRDLPSTGV